jgi:hypothetical protein
VDFEYTFYFYARRSWLSSGGRNKAPHSIVSSFVEGEVLKWTRHLIRQLSITDSAPGMLVVPKGVPEGGGGGRGAVSKNTTQKGRV